MTSIEAWPFIVARNATLDWRPILAPPFLIDAEADYLLVTETSGPGGDQSEYRLTVVQSTVAGTITLAYTSLPATTELIGRSPAEPMVDRFGRPLHVIEGVVIRGAHQALPGDLRAAIDCVRDETHRLLPAFWEEESETAPAVRSQPMHLSIVAEDTSVGPEDEARGRANGSWPALPLALVVVAVFVAAAWWWSRTS